MPTRKLLHALCASAFFAAIASAVNFALPIVPVPAAKPHIFDEEESISGNATFEQLIDHFDPSLGTFSQFYYYNASFWKPGGPVGHFMRNGQCAKLSRPGRRVGASRNRDRRLSAPIDHGLHDRRVCRSHWRYAWSYLDQW